MEFDISHLRMMLYATTKIKNNLQKVDKNEAVLLDSKVTVGK